MAAGKYEEKRRRFSVAPLEISVGKLFRNDVEVFGVLVAAVLGVFAVLVVAVTGMTGGVRVGAVATCFSCEVGCGMVCCIVRCSVSGFGGCGVAGCGVAGGGLAGCGVAGCGVIGFDFDSVFTGVFGATLREISRSLAFVGGEIRPLFLVFRAGGYDRFRKKADRFRRSLGRDAGTESLSCMVSCAS